MRRRRTLHRSFLFAVAVSALAACGVATSNEELDLETVKARLSDPQAYRKLALEIAKDPTNVLELRLAQAARERLVAEGKLDQKFGALLGQSGVARKVSALGAEDPIAPPPPTKCVLGSSDPALSCEPGQKCIWAGELDPKGLYSPDSGVCVGEEPPIHPPQPPIFACASGILGGEWFDLAAGLAVFRAAVLDETTGQVGLAFGVSGFGLIRGIALRQDLSVLAYIDGNVFGDTFSATLVDDLGASGSAYGVLLSGLIVGRFSLDCNSGCVRPPADLPVTDGGISGVSDGGAAFRLPDTCLPCPSFEDMCAGAYVPYGCAYPAITCPEPDPCLDVFYAPGGMPKPICEEPCPTFEEICAGVKAPEHCEYIALACPQPL